MRFPLHAFTLLILSFVGPAAYAQAPSGPLLMGDLCACMGSIDPAAQDRLVNAAVRICLEEAVVHHPGEVLSLLERAPARGNRAYRLGLVLGDVLQRDCPGFRLIQARLQQMPTVVPVSKQGT